MRSVYILDEHNRPQPCDDPLQAAMFMGDVARCRVAEDETAAYRVSTIFLCVDHSFRSEGPPILFETMLFYRDEERPGHMSRLRYATWTEAAAGHARMLAEAVRREGASRTSRAAREGVYFGTIDGQPQRWRPKLAALAMEPALRRHRFNLRLTLTRRDARKGASRIKQATRVARALPGLP